LRFVWPIANSYAPSVFRPEIARTDAVSAAEQTRHFPGRRGRHLTLIKVCLERLAERGADVAGERVVAGQAFVGALDDDDVLLAAEGVDDRGLGEGPDDVDVNGTDLGVALVTQVIAGFLDVFRGATERDEDRVRVVALVLGKHAILAAGQFAEFLVGLLDELEDRFVEVVAAGDHAVHVVLLVLHGAEQQRILQVHHFRHPAAFRAEQFALGRCRAVDHFVRGAEVLAQQFRLGHEVGALRVRRQHAVLDVHARVERQLVDFAHDDRLIRGLLGVLAHHHRPAGVERGIKVVVAAMHVQRVLGQRARADFEHHRRELAGRVVVLLHRVHDALAGGEVDRALAAHGERRRAALRRVLALALDGDLRAAEDVQLTLRVGLLVNLAAFGRGGDRVENAAVGDAGFDVLGHQLVAVARHGDARVLRLGDGAGGRCGGACCLVRHRS
jgi:hypothetical protein